MKYTLSTKLYGLTGGLLVILLVMFMISLIGFIRLGKKYDALSGHSAAKMTASLSAEAKLGSAIEAYKSYLIHADPSYVQEFHHAAKNILAALKEFENNVDTDEERAALKNSMDIAETYDNFINNIIKAQEKKTDIKAIDMFLGKGTGDQFREALNKLEELSRTKYEQDRANIAKLSATFHRLQIALALIAVVAGIVLSIWIVRAILKSVNSVRAAAVTAAKGDLSQEATVYSHDEIGEMARSFNLLITNLRRIAGDINASTGTLASSSEELSATSDDMSKGTRELSTQTEQVVTAMTEVSQTIMDMAKNASQAADASKNASTTAATGKGIVDTSAADMTKIAETVQDAAITIEELGKSSAKIGEIVAVINGIADQTNLLALNAAIEAARAGEQGRGFAVVADEVRKLAERTGQATKDITSRISGIQQAAVESVKAMKKGSEEVDKGVGLAREASTSLDSIVSASTNAMDMVQRIAAATEQQSAATEEVSRDMEHISEITKRSSASTEQIKVSAADLARLAVGLKEMTAWFKVNGSPGVN